MLTRHDEEWPCYSCCIPSWKNWVEEPQRLRQCEAQLWDRVLVKVSCFLMFNCLGLFTSQEITCMQACIRSPWSPITLRPSALASLSRPLLCPIRIHLKSLLVIAAQTTNVFSRPPTNSCSWDLTPPTPWPMEAFSLPALSGLTTTSSSNEEITKH